MNRIKSAQSQTSKTTSSSSAEEFIRTEYEMLNQWAVHGENVTHQIFNFYVTILAAILGGLVLLIQITFIGVQEVLLIVSGVCGFLILIGIVFYDALVSQYIRNMRYHFGMKSIRTYYQQYSEVNSSLLTSPITSENNKESLSSRLTIVKFGFPGGNELALIEVMNSLMVGTAVCCLTWGIAGVGYRFFATIVTSVICWFASEVTHRVLAKLMIQRNVEQINSSLPIQEISLKRASKHE